MGACRTSVCSLRAITQRCQQDLLRQYVVHYHVGSEDQSPRHNDLTIEGAGGAGAADVGAPADALPVTTGGHQVYGDSISAGMGYRNDAISGIAVNGQPDGTYMVTSGTHVNDQCCLITATPR